LQGVANDVTDQRKDINQLDTKVTSAQGDIGNLKSDVAVNKHDIANVRTDVNDQGQRLSDLKVVVDETVVKVEEIDRKVLDLLGPISFFKFLKFKFIILCRWIFC